MLIDYFLIFALQPLLAFAGSQISPPLNAIVIASNWKGAWELL